MQIEHTYTTSVFVTLAVERAVTLMVLIGVEVIVVVSAASKQEHTVDTNALG